MTTPHLEPIVSGNAKGNTILFVQGWPDDASLWDETVAALAPRYRCVRKKSTIRGDKETSSKRQREVIY
jgi:pimeloyl-ACP methyl ester carboxylesterase